MYNLFSRTILNRLEVRIGEEEVEDLHFILNLSIGLKKKKISPHMHEFF